ncbi:hypothetical protein BFW88_02505 [Pseudomonas fluorescens]|nr:hypothetical protein BFW88_02505 [Pseudomonas fluorescens]OPB14780.1 hypothetical protein BFW92_02495 [Pseudomonas fluorescens]OPB28162.1 hypothetical protein BFW93_02505 [Pseudomonas fluorescens]
MALSPITPAPALELPGYKGRHYPFLSAVIPQYLVQASPQNRTALRAVAPTVVAWHAQATAAQKGTLKPLIDATWGSTNAWQTLHDRVQEVTAFARPLLQAGLKKAGFYLDVDQTFLRLYIPVEDQFGRQTAGFKSQTFSLLQAALHNFEARETAADYFNSASGFITQPDARGHFERHTTTLKIETFTQLCRDLDLGAQYQTHLKTFWRPDDAVSDALWRLRYLTYQQDAFKAEAYMALLKGDIGDDDFALLMRVASGEKNIQVDGKQLWYRVPCLMHLRLQGCVLIDPCVKYRYSSWFIAWIPGDPEHPIKRYETFSAFAQELTDRLSKGSTDADGSKTWSPTHYQQFFSRFVAQKDRPYYFRRLTELKVTAPSQWWGIEWLRSEQGHFWANVLAPKLEPLISILGDPAYAKRVPVVGPNLDINADSFKGLWIEVDLWDELYDRMRQRVFEDARTEAVPTADADAQGRSRRLSHYLNLGLLVLNVVSMAVPPLGYAMLTVTAGQLMYETLEGSVEWAQGDREAGWLHLSDVLQNLVMLAAGGVAFHFTVSPFIEQLKSVRLPSGKARLWKPAIEPYASATVLPPESVPDEDGLHRHANQTLLKLEGKIFKVQRSPLSGTGRILHPRREGAYQPEVLHNGSGGWVHEAEQPLTWEQPRLMRRLGPFLDGFNDVELEQIRQVSDVDEDVLRRLNVESEPVPAVLLETARRFRAYADAVKVSEEIAGGRLSSKLASYSAALMVRLPRWPKAWAIEAYLNNGEASVRYGQDATDAGQGLIRISHSDLMAGRLPEQVARTLTPEQAQQMLGLHAPEDPVELGQQLQARLAKYSEQTRSWLFNSLYADPPVTDKAVQILQRDFKGLPTIMSRELLQGASPELISAMQTSGKVPLDLATQAHRLQRQIRLVRAYEGLYLDALAGPDTEALALNTLQTLPGWKDDLRLEVRVDTYDGELRASFGPQDASSRKVLVHVADGQYQAFDEQANSLHGINGFYDSLQHALTDAHRAALGMPHVGQGPELKVLIQQHALPRRQLLDVLQMRPDSRPFFMPTHDMPGGRRGYPLSGRGAGGHGRITDERLRALYPDLASEEIDQLRAAHHPFNDQWLRALEREYRELDAVLQTWMSTPIEGFGEFGSPAYRRQLRIRYRIARALKDAWRRIGPRHIGPTGRYVGQQIDLTGVRVWRQLLSLPELNANFDHVSELMLAESDFSDENLSFLTHFRGLTSLNLESCRLTQLPEQITQMSRLKVLSLSENNIVLSPQAVEQLREVRSLRMLELEGNPLGRVPDISQMPELQLLWLNNTGVNAWPTGLFEQPRPRVFNLDLRGNTINHIPEAEPGSGHAAIIARTVVDRELLSPEVSARLRLYIESSGLDPERRFPPRGAQDSIHWNSGLTPEQWVAKQSVWDALERAPGAEGFFDEIRKLSESSDAVSPDYQNELTAKVWRMLEAAYADTELRDKLFQMAGAPTTCVDAGAQLFNAMGVEVLLSEAYAMTDPTLVRQKVLALAKGKSRLDQLGRIAHARIAELIEQGRRFPLYDADGQLIVAPDAQGNPLPSIDEVEIHLAYATRLAQRLDLPWQSRSMRFPEPDVTQAMIDAAYDRVIELEKGDLLRESLLEQDFWRTYLEGANRAQFDEVSAKGAALGDFQQAQQEWKADGSLSAEQKAALRTTIEVSGRQLGLPVEELTPGREMTDETYFKQITLLGDERTKLLRRLSDEALGRTA